MATFDSRTPTVDTYIDSDAPTTRQDGASWISIRNFTGGGTQRCPILKWDLSSLAGATINSVAVTLNNQASLVTFDPWLAYCYRLDTYAPTNACTWNTYDGSNAWDTAGGDFNATPIQSLAIDTTNNDAGEDVIYSAAGLVTYVANIASGAATDYGLLFALADAGTNQDGKWDPQSDGTEADRPRILIDYTPAGGTSRDIAGSLPAMAGTLTRKHYAKREIGGII